MLVSVVGVAWRRLRACCFFVLMTVVLRCRRSGDFCVFSLLPRRLRCGGERAVDEEGVAMGSSVLVVVTRVVLLFCFRSQLVSLDWSMLIWSVSESPSILAAVGCL